MTTSIDTLIANAESRATTTRNWAFDAINEARSIVQDAIIGKAAELTTLPILTPIDIGKASAAPEQPTFAPVEMIQTADPDAPQSLEDIKDIDTGDKPTTKAKYEGYKAPSTVAHMEPFVDLSQPVKTDFIFPDPPPELLNPRFFAPKLTDLPAPKMGGYNIPHFSASNPVFDAHNLPPDVAVNIQPFNGTAPPTGTFTQPGSAPDFTAPSLDTNLPLDTTIAPTGLSGELSGAYSGAATSMISAVGGYVDAELTKINPEYHSQMAAIETQLTKYLQGGTGLKPEVEDQIYTRARAKNDAESRRVIAAAYADTAARGFTMPTGALFSAAQQARQAGADNNAAGAREIVVMQAEMEQKNLQFAVTTSVSLRKMAIDAVLGYMQTLGTINGQAVDMAKSVVSALVEAYNIQVRNYGQKIEGFKAQLSVYGAQVQAALAPLEGYKSEVQAYSAELQTDVTKANVFQAQVGAYDSSVKAAMAPVEIYKANISGVQAAIGAEKNKSDLFASQVGAFEAETKANLMPVTVYQAEVEGYKAGIGAQSTQVALYKAEVEGQQALAQMYQVQVGAITSQISLEKLKIDIFESQVRAFGAQVQAKDSEYKAYMAEISGEEAKIKAYQAQVQEFQAEAQVWKTKLDGQIAIQESTAKHNEAISSQYKAYVSTLQALIQARSAKAQAEHDVHKVQSTDYQARISHVVAEFNQLAAFARAQSEIDLTNQQKQMETLLEQTRNLRTYEQAMGGMLAAGLSPAAQMAGAALSGMNTLVSQAIQE